MRLTRVTALLCLAVLLVPSFAFAGEAQGDDVSTVGTVPDEAGEVATCHSSTGTEVIDGVTYYYSDIECNEEMKGLRTTVWVNQGTQRWDGESPECYDCEHVHDRVTCDCTGFRTVSAANHINFYNGYAILVPPPARCAKADDPPAYDPVRDWWVVHCHYAWNP